MTDTLERTETLDVRALKVIDTDTHVSEPPDLWTSRVPAKWNDVVPHVEFNAADRPQPLEDRRLLADGHRVLRRRRLEELPAERPVDLDQEGVDPGSWDPNERLRRMDEYGIYAQVLYPNLIGFETGPFMELGHELSPSPASQAYNDFLAEFASADPKRFIPIAMVPFWDLDASVTEIERCHEIGHQGHPVRQQVRADRPADVHRPALGSRSTRWPGPRAARSTSTSASARSTDGSAHGDERACWPNFDAAPDGRGRTQRSA